jgi:hypothetical protein
VDLSAASDFWSMTPLSSLEASDVFVDGYKRCLLNLHAVVPHLRPLSKDRAVVFSLPSWSLKQKTLALQRFSHGPRTHGSFVQRLSPAIEGIGEPTTTRAHFLRREAFGCGLVR